jgi:hypothetical protein
MSKNSWSFVRRVLFDQRGQALPWVVAGTLTLLGMAGLTADVGHGYVVHDQLQNAANAAALAAANSVNISGTTVTNEGCLYSAGSGDQNAIPYATGNCTSSVTQVCLNMLMPVTTPATTCANGGDPMNAVKVTLTASVPTYFMNVFGISHMPMSATAFAAMSGSTNNWNIALIMDATGSMATGDTGCPGGTVSEFQCALNSIQLILADTPACPSGVTSCGPGTSTTANVRVALFTFPNMVTSAVSSFNSAGCSNSLSGYTEPAPYQVYTLPIKTASSYSPLTYTENGKTWTATYELTYGASDADANGFVSDYYSPNNAATGNLNPSSSLVELVGYGGDGGGTNTGSGAVQIGATSSRTPCMPIAPGGIALNGATGASYTNAIVNTVNVGEGITYYASVIYAAQAALTAEHAAFPQANNAIILLSDGQANTQWIYFPQGTVISSGETGQGQTNTSAPSTISSTLGLETLNTTFSTTAYVAGQLSTPNQEVASGKSISGLYPDFLDECQQAIAAAQYAAETNNNTNQTTNPNVATRVYGISYGSEQSGCGTGSHADDYTDVTLVTTGMNVPFSSTADLTPCITMENIASDLKYFYSDYLQSGSSVDTHCVGTVNNIANLNQIAFDVSASFKNAKLLPPDADTYPKTH